MKFDQQVFVESISVFGLLERSLTLMFSFDTFRPVAIAVAILISFAQSAFGADVLDTLPIDATAALDFQVPARPTGHVLDTAHFLTPEILERIERELSQEARAHGVSIYLLTVPSLKKDTLDPFTKRVAKEWMTDLFGATIVFDDGTGVVSIQQSDQVTKRFYEFELSLLLKDTMSLEKRPRLSRAGLEHTTMSVKEALHELKMRANRDNRKSMVTRVSLYGLGSIAVLLGVLDYFRRRNIANSGSKKAEV